MSMNALPPFENNENEAEEDEEWSESGGDCHNDGLWALHVERGGEVAEDGAVLAMVFRLLTVEGEPLQTARWATYSIMFTHMQTYSELLFLKGCKTLLSLSRMNVFTGMVLPLERAPHDDFNDSK